MTVKKVGDGSHIAAGPDSINEASSVTEPIYRGRVTGDAYDRVQITGAGVATGDGTAAPTVGTFTSPAQVALSSLARGSQPVKINAAARVTNATRFGTTSTYDAFGVVRQVPNGDLVYIYRSGTSHVGTGDYGVMKLRRSTDGGLTYGAPVTVLSEASIDIRNYCIGVTDTGRLVVVYTRYNPDTTTWLNMKVIYSDDNGVTWSTPAAFVTSPLATVFSAYGAVRQIDGGRLLASFYADDSTAATTYVAFSDDNGATWSGTVAALVGTVASNQYTEACYAYIGEQIIIGLVRREQGGGHRQLKSTDNGATWSNMGAVTFDANANAGKHPAWLETGIGPDGEKFVACVYSDEGDGVVKAIIGALDGSAGTTIVTNVSGWLTTTLTATLGGAGSYPSIVFPGGRPWGVGVWSNEISASNAGLYQFNYRAAIIQGTLHTRGPIVPASGTQALTGGFTATGAVTAQLGSASAVVLGNLGGARPGVWLGATFVVWVAGSGTPEAQFAAEKGSLWSDITNGELYIKTTGSGNTGWKIVTHA